MSIDFPAVIDAFFYILKAVPNTLFMAAVTLIGGIILGAGIAVIRLGHHPIINTLLAIWVSFTRSVPAIVQIFIAYYSIPYLLAPVLSVVYGTTVKFYDVSPYWTGYILFILFHAAFQSENIRGAILSVPKGQYEAAVTVGMSPFMAYKRIVFPQALAVVLPTFFTYYLHAIKGISLLFTIKVVDIFAAANLYASLYSRRTEPYIADAAIYWILCILLTFVFNWWEKQIRKHGMTEA